jgi:hypothetical protein
LYSVESEFGSFPLLFTHCPSILFIAFPVSPGKRLTGLSLNAAPDEGRQPASGARQSVTVLRRGLGLSSPGVLLERPRDALRSLLGSMHLLGSFLCVAWGRRRSSPCPPDVTGGVSGGGHSTVHCQTTQHDPGGEAPFVPVVAPSESTPLPLSHGFTGKARRPRVSPGCSRVGALNAPSGNPFPVKEPPHLREALGLPRSHVLQE